MSTRSRTLKYLPGHELRFGIAAVSQDASSGEVDEAVCLFCKCFGREQRAEKKRKCASTVKYFRDCFRPDQYTQHHQLQHPTQWLQYKDLSDNEKRNFFSLSEEGTKAAIEISSTFSPLDQVVIPEIQERGRCFDIMAVIVEIVAVIAVGMGPVEPTVQTRDRLVYEYMTHHNYIGELPSNCPRWSPPPNTFERCFVVQKEPPIYRVVLYAKTQLDFVMELAAEGLSGAQIAASIKTFRLYAPVLLSNLVRSSDNLELQCTFSDDMAERAEERTLLSPCVSQDVNLEYNEAQTTEFVRFGLAVCFNMISKLLEESWAFSLELCTIVQHPAFSYLDVRVRFYNRIEGLRSAHLLAIPKWAGCCDNMMFRTINRVLTALLPCWRTKLLGVTTTGDLPFPVRFNEVISHFQHAARRLVLYRASNCISQLQYILHTFYASIDNGNFLQTQKKLSDYIRKEPCVLSKIKRLPGFREQLDTEVYRIPSSPMAFGQEMEIIATNSLFLRGHFRKATPSSNASFKIPVMWWLELQVIQWITARANAVFEVLMKHDVPISKQATVMASLAEILITSLHAHIYEDTTSVPLFTFTEYISVDKRVALSKTHIEKFILSASELARDLIKHDDDRTIKLTAECFATGAVNMIASLIELSVSLKQQCATCVSPAFRKSPVMSDVLPPVMPHELALLSSDEFDEMLGPNDPNVKSIQEEQRSLRQAFAEDEDLRSALEKCTPETPFRVAWSLMDTRFETLKAFAGGLATVWPSHVVPIADKSPCSLALCSKDMEEARLLLADFELESALHAQQFQALTQLQEKLYEKEMEMSPKAPEESRFKLTITS